MNPCIVDGCKGRRVGWNFCDAHYRRWRLYGDPLGGQTMRGEPGRYLKEVVLNYVGTECLPWPFCRSRKGYGQISIGRRVPAQKSRRNSER